MPTHRMDLWTWGGGNENRMNGKVAAAARSLQSCPTLCDAIDCSPPGSPVPGILQPTGVGCHILLQCMTVKSESEVAQSCLTLQPHGLQPTRLLRPGLINIRCHVERREPVWKPQSSTGGSARCSVVTMGGAERREKVVSSHHS